MMSVIINWLVDVYNGIISHISIESLTLLLALTTLFLQVIMNHKDRKSENDRFAFEKRFEMYHTLMTLLHHYEETKFIFLEDWNKSDFDAIIKCDSNWNFLNNNSIFERYMGSSDKVADNEFQHQFLLYRDSFLTNADMGEILFQHKYAGRYLKEFLYTYMEYVNQVRVGVISFEHYKQDVEKYKNIAGGESLLESSRKSFQKILQPDLIRKQDQLITAYENLCKYNVVDAIKKELLLD